MQAIVENAHVEVTAGRNKGALGYISDAGSANVQITTGNGMTFNVRRTSLRVLANPVRPNVTQHGCRCREARQRARDRNVGVPRQQRRINNNRVKELIERMGVILEDSVTLAQWREVTSLVKRTCRIHEDD